MADSKKYTAREAAFAVLAKAQEMLAKSELAKALDPKAGLGKPAPPTPAPMLAMSEELGKAENPDEKQDAKLGEDVEHLCEDHMMENKAAERKEGHKIVKAEDCMKCNMKKPTPSTGQGDTLRRPASEAKWQMDKTELNADLEKLEGLFKGEMKKQGAMPLGGTGMGAPSTPTSRPSAGFGSITAKSEEGVGSKKLGYKPSKLGEEEKEAEMPSDGAFKVKHIDDKSSNDPRLGSTPDPDKSPKEHAEGNNAEPGSKPSVEANQSQDTAPVKGHLKLAKFIGRMEHKRSMAKSEMEKSQGYPTEKYAGQKGVHEPMPVYEKGKGVTHGRSDAGQKARQVSSGRGTPEVSGARAKAAHKKVLDEVKAMPKPNLPKSEAGMGKAEEDRSKMSGKSGMVRGTTEANENQKGVHTLGSKGSSGGISQAGGHLRDYGSDPSKQKISYGKIRAESVKPEHKEKLSELKAMPKPKLPK